MDKYEIKDFRRQTLKLGDIVYRADGGYRGNNMYFGVVVSILGQKFAMRSCLYETAPSNTALSETVRVDKHYFDSTGEIKKPRYITTLSRTGGDIVIMNDIQPSDKEYHARAIKLRAAILHVVKINGLDER